ncbi:hypothetical protein EW145_g7647 [Phellinidium pouzarii]|uniref:CCHC-type domain-containing protein n=1 Tax=Phellinidium pouzarii TaxID=167371 RepID=A0A4S4KKU0_9AGAM|nr:hypothetical protein EW145_g7647 [Phellinidium pouzarii]
MASTSLKILTLGPAVGSIRELFTKVKAIDAKYGKFELVLCVGDFFGPNKGTSKEIDELLKGEIEVPITCYVMQGDYPIPQAVIQKFSETGSELCQNLFLLSKSSLLTTSHGLRIACLGGVYDEQVYSSAESPLGFSDPYFSSQTVEKLLSNVSTTTSTSNTKNTSLASFLQTPTSSHLVDIFISHVWPASITSLSNSAPNAAGRAVAVVDDIVKRAKPKYHFATGAGGLPQFWEREPFVWADEDERITRFVSLGAFGGEHGPAKKGPRWFYAFSIAPPSSTAPAQTKPANLTANPFTSAAFSRPSSTKRPVDMAEVENFIFGAIQQPLAKKARHEREGGKPPPGYKCRICESTEHFISDCPEKSKPPEGYVCKICNNPGHLIRECPVKNATGDTGGRKPPPGYVCRACASENHMIQDCPAATQTRREPRGKNRGPPREIGPNECWFCLSNPSVAKHLIVSIGSEYYLTLPKGQIIPTGDSADPASDISKVPGGGHVLLVPIAHCPTLAALPPDLAEALNAEITQCKAALRSLYSAHGCRALIFEVGLVGARGGHAHAQVVPIPARLEGQVEAAFRGEGARVGMEFEEDPEKALETCAGGRGNYFRVDLPDGRMMVYLIKQDVPFSIQFGRQVLCRILGVPERFDWKACTQTESEERADAQAFKQSFASFDPTLK